MKGYIFNIQKFCTHDGEGIRTCVFLKGCPMACKWCHNPESLDIKSTMAYFKSKCIGCGKCVSVCENKGVEAKSFQFIKDKCVKCEKCIEICPNSAREKFGYEASVDEIMENVGRDKIFYDNSGGGVTFSGGEPTYQYDFLMALLKRAKEMDIKADIETNSFTEYEKLKNIAPYIDCFLMDIKAVDDEKHKYWTGVSNKIILDNIKKVSHELKANILFRVPVIPNVNNSCEDLDLLADFINSLNNKHKVELMPYHDIGISKYEACGMDYEMGDLKSLDSIEDIKEYLIKKNVQVVNE